MNFMRKPEKAVMMAIIMLLATGLIFIFSVSGPYSQLNEHSSWYYFLRQFAWAILALTALYLGSIINYRNFLKLAPALFIGSLVLLVWVLLKPAQMNVNRWLGFSFVNFQPSEVFKLTAIMYFAYALIDNKNRPKKLKKIWPHFVLAGAGILMIAKQPDLGTLSLVFTVLVVMLFLAGLKIRYLLVAGAIIGMLGVGMVYGLARMMALCPEVITRIVNR